MSAALACLGVATHVVFRAPASSAPDTVALHPMTYLAFPFLLWAGFYYEEFLRARSSARPQ